MYICACRMMFPKVNGAFNASDAVSLLQQEDVIDQATMLIIIQ